MLSPSIAVFDSGFGGLTVLRALLRLIPNAHYIYLGDTARLPYGSKSQATVARYALRSAQFLLHQGADLLVVACNTATALALAGLQDNLPIPVLGVIEPGAQAAVASSSFALPTKPQVLVLATAATVASRAYSQALATLGLSSVEKACPLLVPLVEEGWIDHPVTAQILRIYLTEALSEAPDAATLILGCTHYPLLQPLIARTLAELGRPLPIVDAAQATAEAAAALLPPQSAPSALIPRRSFYATDSIDKFASLGPGFLGQPIPEVHLLDLGG
jgi:glutamate racemase